MEKLRVLIVDDERRIAKLVEKLIHWDEYNLELAGLYEDGQQAYDAILTQNPDIVITDIRMPIMDGLEMIRRIHEQGQRAVSFIVVSGYREFEYAHTALRYGVEDYLLKPVNEKELNDILLRLSKTHTNEQFQVEKSAREAAHKRELQCQQAVDFLIQNEWHDSLAKFNDEYEISLQDVLFSGFCVKFDHRNRNETDQRQDRLVLRNAVQLLTSELGSCTVNQMYSISADMTIVGFLNVTVDAMVTLPQAYQRAFSKLKDYVYAFSQYEVTFASGSAGPFSAAHESLLTAERGIYSRIVFGTGKIILPEDLQKGKELSSLDDILDVARLNISNAIQSFSAPQLSRHIDSAFAQVREKHFFSADAYYETAIAIARLVYGQGAMSSEERSLLEDIRSCWSLVTLVDLLKDRLCAKIAEMQAELQNRSNKPIRTAIEYVETHYAERISLDDIAAMLQLNPTYFSTLFKKETGTNFLAYITEYRIEKAKALLCSTNDTMASIAEKVGYADTRYFSQCFERVAGVKPSLYRKMYS